MRLHWTLSALLGMWLTASVESASPTDVQQAIKRSLALIEKSTIEYREHRQCFSCHHQAMPVLTLTMAKERGYKLDEKNLQAQLELTAEHLKRGEKNYRKGTGQGGGVDTAGYALWTLEAGNWKPDQTTSAVVEYLLQRDNKVGYWRSRSNRPPSEASHVTTSALALRALDVFGSEKEKKRIEERKKATREWLLKFKPRDTEDHVFRLQGLHYLDVSQSELKTSIDQLIKLQRKDGGWSQKPDMQSDAYATGSVLVTLSGVGSISGTDPVYQRGIDFLMKAQLPDGSWHVQSRSKPFQKYFESGFPHKKNQFISISASSWATQALMLSLPSQKK